MMEAAACAGFLCQGYSHLSIMPSQLNLGLQLTRLAGFSWWRALAGLRQMPPSSCLIIAWLLQPLWHQHTISSTGDKFNPFMKQEKKLRFLLTH